jgi:hypothetical protein
MLSIASLGHQCQQTPYSELGRPQWARETCGSSGGCNGSCWRCTCTPANHIAFHRLRIWKCQAFFPAMPTIWPQHLHMPRFALVLLLGPQRLSLQPPTIPMPAIRRAMKLHLFVHPNHTRQGVGKTLMDRIMPSLDMAYRSLAVTDFQPCRPCGAVNGRYTFCGRLSPTKPSFSGGATNGRYCPCGHPFPTKPSPPGCAVNGRSCPHGRSSPFVESPLQSQSKWAYDRRSEEHSSC